MVVKLQAARSLQVLTRRDMLAGLSAVAGSTLASRGATATSRVALIMVDDPNCRYCRQFEAEIGRGYPKTAEGRFAPLIKVLRKSPRLSSFAPVIYTPTFLLVRETTEIGRITGYPGVDFFYGELGELLARAGFAQASPGADPSET
jgi:hypothetical protein